MDQPEIEDLPPTAPVIAPVWMSPALLRAGILLAVGLCIGVLVGLAAGGKSSVPVPAPIAAAPTASAGGTLVPTAAPSVALTETPQAANATPPTDALELPAALTALGKAGFGATPNAVIEARLTTVADLVAATPDGTTEWPVSPETWVWSFVIHGSFPPASCGAMTLQPHPCPSPATTMRILLDGRTGALIEARTPAP